VIALDFIPEQHEEGLKLGPGERISPQRFSLLEDHPSSERFLHGESLSTKPLSPWLLSPWREPLLEASLLGALLSTEKCVNGHEKLDEESINSLLNRRGHLKVNEKQH
jgi:hypothetical protein